MSYDAREQSEYAGQPQELFLFTAGSTNFAYTSADLELSHNAISYGRADIDVSDIVQSIESEQVEITVTMSRTLDFPKLFVKMLPPFDILATIYRRHYQDSETIAWWNGQVVATSIKGAVAEVRCAPLISVYQRLGVRRLFQPTCNHMLYDPDTCRVDPNAFKSNATISAINGSTLDSATFAGQADGYYTAGFIRRPLTGDLRMIVDHVGDTITLWYPFEDMPTFETLEVFAGCDHSDVTCFNKFNNLVNNGSWPTVPLINPSAKQFA